ncbi:IclR family transcriptional regulator [Mycobacterium sp. Aquia_216]|uniref:IclR family transcriptional regulator n=1 Tax=Mycobacterium sp. Aquia_216 TaxID=2991729 RepID=UPI00227B4573|nr:IclR family transcriptional regulator [Mycobacterium sp. Aquia_216]WAJ45298.1 IclR family transcriptional regulator [Mycobacterium sp. Aquia_216]
MTVREKIRSDPEPAEGPASSPTVAHRVVTLLGLVGRHEGGIGVRDAERATGIDRSAVSRIFRQLESLGWVEQVDDRGTYVVGREMFSVAAAVRQRDSLWLAAEPLLRALTDRFDETTYLAGRRDHRVVFQDKVDCIQPIRYVIELNKPFPLTTGAAGRAILSALPREEIDEVIADGLFAYTPTSITEPDKYRVQLERDRRLGYAYSKSGWIQRGAGVASPFFDASGACTGAITLSAPIDRLTPAAVRDIGPAVCDAAQQLSRRLGYSGGS